MRHIAKKISWSILATIILVVVLTAIPTLTHRSTKEIISKTLESALVNKQLPDYQLLLDKSNSIIVSNENIDTTWIPQLPGISLTVLSPSAVQEKAEEDGEFLYLRFTKIKIGNLTATVSLDNTWINPTNNYEGYLSGGGFTLKFYNVLGNWVQSPMIQSWIS